MNKKSILIVILGFIVFCSLVGFNYLLAQKKLRETRPSPLNINLQSFPEKVQTGQTGSFIWEIDSSPDLITPQTTIFWGYTASPSALTVDDSPAAVGYPYHQDDYYNGVFKLPDVFDLSVKFDKPGTVFFRAFAKVGDNYLWTEEKSIEITP